MKALEVAAGLVSLGVLLYAGAVVFFPHQSAPITALAKRPVRVRRNAKALAMAYPEGVNESRWLAVGGRQQWVTLRGAHVANPVLVIIHGGPASSYIPFNPQLGGWEKHFTVLQWDQRGAGQTYLGQGADDNLTLDQLVADGRDLVAWVSSQLPQAEVVLVGSSVGTVIATRIAEQAPHLVDRLVLMDALGPGARAESWRLTRDALHARGRTKDVMALDAVGSDPIGWTAEQAETVSKLAIDARPDVPHMVYDVMLPALMFSPDYKLAHLRAIETSMKIARDRLYPELRDPNLCGVALDMPVLVIQGAGDLVNPVSSARQLSECLGARFVSIPGAGHLVEFAQPDAVLHELLVWCDRA